MVVQGWFSKPFCNLKLLAAALFALQILVPRSALATDPPAASVDIVPALPAGAETSTYVDPRKRFSIRHDAKWVLMVNWAGGVEAFCRWVPCQTSTMTSCTISLTSAEGLSDKDLALFNAAMGSGLTGEKIELGFLGDAQFLSGNTVRQIGGIRWFVSGIGLKLFDTIPLETRNWWGLSAGFLINSSCVAHKDNLQQITIEMERLLSGLAFTKP